MVEPNDRQFIYNLRKEECILLLQELGKDFSGSVPTLRMRLSTLAKKATEEEIEIFLSHRLKYEERKDVEVFRKYAEQLPFQECHEVLADLKGESDEPEEAQRKALIEALNETVGEDREGWLEMAEVFCKKPISENTRKGDAIPADPSPNMDEREACDSDETQSSVNLENINECHRSCRAWHSTENTLPKMAQLMDQARRWNLKFQGGNPEAALQFIEDLEEKSIAYDIPLDALPKAMPEFLKGSASNWYRSNKEDWNCWEDFKDSFLLFFVPSRLRLELEDEIRSYKQKPNQSINDFIIEIQTMMRRVSGFTKTNQLNRIYANLLCDYQLYFKRSEFSTLQELKTLGEDYEYKIKNKNDSVARKTHHPHQKNSGNAHRSATLAVETPPSVYTVPQQQNPFRQSPITHDSNPRTHTDFVCYNCNKPGHTSRFCRQPRIPTCRNCRKRGIRTEDCKCRENNVSSSFCEKCRRQGYRADTCPCSQPSTSGGSNHHSVSTIISKNISALDNRPRRDVEILGKTFNALLDSGATTSYINQSVVSWLEENKEPGVPVNICTYMANQSIDCANKAYDLEVRMESKIFRSQFLVMKEMSDEVTIGSDCLKLLNFELVEIDRDPRINKISYLVHENHLSPSEENTLKELLDTELKKCEEIKGGTTLTEHRICMKSDEPIRQRYFPKNPKMREIISKQVDELLADGHIEPSASPYCSPIVLVKKKDNTWRMCVDFRKINEHSERDAYPMPHIPSILNRLRNARYISSIDLKNGYWQIPIRPEDRQFTAFVVPGKGLFQWRVMPFGLHSAPATFQRLLDTLVCQKFEGFAVAYLDDIIIYSETFSDHLIHLRKVLHELQEANLRINAEKSVFCKSEIKYLGHIVGNGGIQTDPDKIKAINELQPPKDITGVRRILGMVGWYSKFIPNYTKVVAPLIELLSKKNKFDWGERQDAAFIEIKRKMTEAPIIACPDYSRPFFLQTDASNIGLGAVLFQRDGDKENVIAYRSRSLKPAEKNYTTTEKECLAVVWGIEKNKEFLEGIPFTVITDHLSLKWIFKLPNPSGRLGRWVVELRNHDFTIEYRKGKLNVVPDTLSREPLPICSTLTTLKDPWLEKLFEGVSKSPEKFPEFQIIEGRLFRNCGRGDVTEDCWKLCVSKSDRDRVLRENHDNVTAGHFGIRKTFDRICQKYYWPGLFKDMKKFVNRCHICLCFKASQQKSAGLMNTTQTSYPWEVITVDFIGPLPKSSKQNKHLLVIQDKFTKWVECVPLREATAVGLKKAIRERIFCRFGWPKKLISDNGSQFTSKDFVKFLKDNFVLHVLTPPYSPQCNSTERANRTIKTLMKIYLKDNQKKWDEQLPEIQFAINTSNQESTGFSSAVMNFGRDLRPPNSFYEDQTGDIPKPPVNPAENNAKISEILRIARRNLAKAQARQAKHYNKKRRVWSPKINSLVYKREFPLSKGADGFAAKLAPNYSGPYRLLSFISPSIVELQNVENEKVYRVHLKDIKQINENESSVEM